MTVLLIIILILIIFGGGYGLRSGTITHWGDPIGLILLVLLIVVIFSLVGYPYLYR